MERQYFIFNKELDYSRGYCENLSYESGLLRIKDLSQKKGCFLSRVLDCREKDMIWQRLRLGCENMGDGSFSLALYSSSQPVLAYEGERCRIEALIQSKRLSLKEKLKIMEQARQKSSYEEPDLLLHDVTGRYLWFYLELLAQEGKSPFIRQIRIDFPKHTWLEYLPELYQQEEKSRNFMERYLGIFQGLYDDMTEQIDNITEWFDPDCAGEEMLPWLSEWISIADVPIWNGSQLRYLIQNMMSLYQIRGTADYLKQMIHLYTGGLSYVVEYHEMNRYQNNLPFLKRLKKLYGEQEYLFTVLIDTGDLMTAKEYQTLLRIVDHARPAHMECRVVRLQQYIFLDQYSYLGINSRLGQYRTLKLDGLSAIHFTKIENKTGAYES